ncbi:DNA damage-regulated autophagy modulator protein 2-like [Oppia nitens]|uniref:DNA damage-regulated autophagy modulator protein 2-like n=1 Tax=Oppia nitens TaxID=1686743 RepID=UPI0023DC0C63|nr:DNA damage-regulated autophagy modulator protein 2-like [Oppia nitens]
MVWTNLHYIPLAVFVLLPTTFITTYIIAILLGHVEVELPYISDTGTHVPESSLFAQLLNFCAFLVGVTIYVRYKQIEQYYRDNLTPESTKIFCRNRIAFICGLISSVGLSMVANFRELELFKIHMVGATLAFGFGAIYCWLQTIMSYAMHPLVNSRQMAHFRLALSSLMTCTFTVSCVCGPWAMRYFHGKDPTNWKPEDGAFGLHLAATVCEWITALAIDFFVLSYVEELKKISMSTPKVLFIIEEDIERFGDNMSETDDTVAIIHASLPSNLRSSPATTEMVIHSNPPIIH